MEKDFSLKAKLEAFKETNAVFKGENGERYVWPIKKLPEDMKVGQEIRFLISTEGTEQAEREKVAKQVLNEILKGDEEKEDKP